MLMMQLYFLAATYAAKTFQTSNPHQKSALNPQHCHHSSNSNSNSNSSSSNSSSSNSNSNSNSSNNIIPIISSSLSESTHLINSLAIASRSHSICNCQNNRPIKIGVFQPYCFANVSLPAEKISFCGHLRWIMQRDCCHYHHHFQHHSR